MEQNERVARGHSLSVNALFESHSLGKVTFFCFDMTSLFLIVTAIGHHITACVHTQRMPPMIRDSRGFGLLSGNKNLRLFSAWKYRVLNLSLAKRQHFSVLI